MKNSVMSIVVCVTLFSSISMNFVTSMPVETKMPKTGYIKDAKVRSSGQRLPCGTNTFAIVANEADEIDTGTEIWANPNMTAHYPDGIITSMSGSTYGQSFFVVDGIVGASATPC
jgi:hypothetical protein